MNYYDNLHACIQTKRWISAPFRFDIGLFQGCVLSCSLFSSVFQLLLDLLDPLTEKHGYHFKDSSIILHDQAFADDISITSYSPKANQASINQCEYFFTWAHFKAKPPKCVCMGMKKFDPRNTHKVEYERYGNTVYVPFDPDLKIAGSKIRFIVNTAADPESLQYDHFKELGRFISVDLGEDKIRSEIRKRLLTDIGTIETSGVNGLCKLFLYEHFAVSRLSWAFLVQDLCLSFAQSLEDLITVKLKIWAGLYRSAEVGTLYRHREHLGLQLTSITSHFMHLQLVRSCLLANSQDPLIQEIFSRKSVHMSSFAHRWSGPKALSTLAPIASHNIRFAGQTDHTGLGSMRSSYLSNPTAAAKLMSNCKKKNACTTLRV